MFRKIATILFVALMLAMSALGQIRQPYDSTKNYTFAWKQTILPATLIGAGALALAPNFAQTASHNITNTLLDLRGSRPRLTFDDYVQYVPLASTLALNITGVKSRHSLGLQACIIGTTAISLTILTQIPKASIQEQRPQFSGRNSFPSGHTATAFAGAELVRIEYGNWFGAGAYAIATSVAFMRMYNGRHWFNDVIAGVGVGILSARIAQWICPIWHKILPKKSPQINVVFIPIW